MELFKNVVEYYEELFPVTEDVKSFFAKERESFSPPHKFLRIGCGTGSYELFLSLDGSDITGLETCPELLESASRKRRTQLMSVRFFNMSTLEMGRYLGKGFYNIISVLDDRLMLIHDKTLLEKFFYDCRKLLSPEGKLILSLPNFSFFTSEESDLPVRESMRVKLFSKIKKNSSGQDFLYQTLENGKGNSVMVSQDVPVYKVTPQEIKEMAIKNGFNSVSFFSDFKRNELKPDSEQVVAVLQ